MAVFYIEEFQTLAVDPALGTLPIPQQPALATQIIAIGAGSVASAAFNANTRFVRIATDAPCSYLFGASPTAIATTPRMGANTDLIFGVVPGQKVAVITNT